MRRHRPCWGQTALQEMRSVATGWNAVGLLVGMFQALTQIQDHTLSFVPKIIAMILVLTLCLPWFLDQMVEFSRSVISNIPTVLGGG